jgi:hypothetical protein
MQHEAQGQDLERGFHREDAQEVRLRRFLEINLRCIVRR